MATNSSILAQRIPWTEEPGELQSIASQRVGHDYMTNSFVSEISLGTVYLFEKTLSSILTQENINEQIRQENCTLSSELFQVQNVQYKMGSYKHLSSGLVIDDHPFRIHRAFFIAGKLEMRMIFSSHHKVQSEDWIFLDKIIKT